MGKENEEPPPKKIKTDSDLLFTSDFKQAHHSEYYIDKTLFIYDVIDNSTDAILIIAPKRFGKTLLLDMSVKFLRIEVNRDGITSEIDIAEKKKYFCDKFIWKEHKEFCENNFGCHPVLRIDFKDLCIGETFDQCLKNFSNFLSMIFRNYYFLYRSKDLPDCFKESFVKYRKGSQEPLEEQLLVQGLGQLAFYLQTHFDKKVYVLVDEFDSLLQKIIDTPSNDNLKITKLIKFMQGVMSNLIKSNESVQKSIIFASHYIGGIFSHSANNVVYYKFNEEHRFSSYLGFTEEELKKFENYFQHDLNLIKHWYNGYGNGVYCPWSIMSYLNYGKLESYWSTTSFNLFGSILNQKEVLSIVEMLLKEEDNSLSIQYEEKYSIHNLMDLQLAINNKNVNEETSHLWFQYMTDGGYFKLMNLSDNIATIQIPNQDIRKAIKSQINFENKISVKPNKLIDCRSRFKEDMKNLFKEDFNIDAVRCMAKSLLELSAAAEVGNHVELQSELRSVLIDDDIKVGLENAVQPGIQHPNRVDLTITYENTCLVAELKIYRESARKAMEQIFEKKSPEYFRNNDITAKKKKLMGIYIGRFGWKAVIEILYGDHRDFCDKFELDKATKVKIVVELKELFSAIS